MSTIAPVDTRHRVDAKTPFAWWCALCVCIVWGYAPLLIQHLYGLWARDYYQYFPFVIAAVVWLVWSRWPEGPVARASGSRVAAAKLIVSVAFAFLAMASVFWSPWLAAVSAVLALGAIALVLRRHGRRIVNLFGIWCLLWLLIPIPLGFDNRAVAYLQLLSSRLSSGVLDIFGVNHLMSGTVLQLPGREFFIDEACSGIISVMSVIATGAVFVVWMNRPLLHAVALILAGIGWAVLMNVARIVTIAVAHDARQLDWSSGWQHNLLGFALFCLTFIAPLSTDRLLCFGLGPVWELSEQPEEHNPIIRVWNAAVTAFDPVRISPSASDAAIINAAIPGATPVSTRTMFFVSSAFALLGAAQLVSLCRGDGDSIKPVERALSIERGFLPARVGPWQMVDFQESERESMSEFGQYSRAFVFRHGRTHATATISLDFPFRGGWHELSVCYRNVGWPMTSRKVSDFSVDGTSEPWKVVQAEYAKPTGECGYLAFSGTNGSATCSDRLPSWCFGVRGSVYGAVCCDRFRPVSSRCRSG